MNALGPLSSPGRFLYHISREQGVPQRIMLVHVEMCQMAGS